MNGIPEVGVLQILSFLHSHQSLQNLNGRSVLLLFKIKYFVIFHYVVLMPDDLHVPWTIGHASAIYLGPPEVENVTFARPGLGDRATELLLSVLDVCLPVKNLYEVKIAVVRLLKKSDENLIISIFSNIVSGQNGAEQKVRKRHPPTSS